MARRIVLGRRPELSERSSIVNHLDLCQISRFDRSYPRFQTLNLTGCEIDTFELTGTAVFKVWNFLIFTYSFRYGTGAI